MIHCDEDPSITNDVSELEVFIDRPVGDVWRPLLDLSSWVTTHVIEEVSETKRTVGAITRVSFKRAKEMGYPLPHHHYCKIIKLVPEQLYVLKTYSEKGGSYGSQIAAFDVIRLVTLDRGTRLTFSFFGEFRGARIEGEPRRESAPIDMDVSLEGMKINLDNLKRIVEGR